MPFSRGSSARTPKCGASPGPRSTCHAESCRGTTDWKVELNQWIGRKIFTGKHSCFFIFFQKKYFKFPKKDPMIKGTFDYLTIWNCKHLLTTSPQGSSSQPSCCTDPNLEKVLVKPSKSRSKKKEITLTWMIIESNVQKQIFRWIKP